MSVRHHWPRWPTGSPDPLVNILATGILVIVAIMALATSFLLLVPVAIAFGVIGFLRWYHNRPPPYANPAIAAAVEQHAIAANFPETDAFAESYLRRLVDAWHPRLPPAPVFVRIVEVAADLYDIEAFNNPVPPLPADPIDQGRWRDEMRIHAEKMHDAPKTLALFTEALTASLTAFRDALPENVLVTKGEFLAGSEGEPPFTVSADELIGDPEELAGHVALPFYTEETRSLRLFQALKSAIEQDGIPGTPLQKLFDAEVPFILPEEARFAGQWIVSPPGRGKTTLLHAMVMADIRNPDASLILMDSKGDLIDPIRNLAEIQDRLIVIDPDPKNPVAINPLDIARTDLAQSVDLLEYLFASLLEFKMTAMQTTLFRSVLRALVLEFPNPTLETFRDLLSNGYEKYKAHIERLPPDLQDFFYRDFNEKGYADRRREVLQRLRLLLDNETMRAMLTAATTRFRVGEAMDNGKIVVINNSKARLGDQGAEFFGRFFIAQVLAAAQQRSSRKGREDKPPVYFYIDECQNVIARDEKIPTILDECRSQNIALIMAHQRIKQIASDNVLDALSNCAIRFANSDEEARFLAPRLRTRPEFLQSLGRGRFAVFVRDMTKEAVAVSVNPVDFRTHRSVSESDRNAIGERMREQYGAPMSSPPGAEDEVPESQTEPAHAPVSRDVEIASKVRGGGTAGHNNDINTNGERRPPTSSPKRPRSRPTQLPSETSTEGARDWC